MHFYRFEGPGIVFTNIRCKTRQHKCDIDLAELRVHFQINSRFRYFWRIDDCPNALH